MDARQEFEFDAAVREVELLLQLLDVGGKHAPVQREIDFRLGLQRIAAFCAGEAGVIAAVRRARDHGIRAFVGWPGGPQRQRVLDALDRLALQIEVARTKRSAPRAE